jgi:F-type H+-transporting ATPase subunit O
MAARSLSILTRQFSTSTASQALVRTPVPVYGIEGRYAAALFSAASKNDALGAVEADLTTITNTMNTDPRLAEFLQDPSVTKSTKLEGLVSVCQKLGVNDLSKNLLLSLAENNRIGYISAVASSYSTVMAATRGEVACTITTAKPLDAEMAKEVEGALGGFLNAGEKALVTFKIDPSIVGGMVVSIGDKFCDMSMSSKLNKYSELIKGAA